MSTCNCTRCRKTIQANQTIWLGDSALSSDPYCKECASKVALNLPELNQSDFIPIGAYGGPKKQ